MKRGLTQLLLLFVAILLLVTAGQILARPEDDPNDNLPGGTFVARLYYNELADLQNLVDYDVWEYNNLHEKYVLVSLDSAIYHQLTAKGWQMAIDEEATANLNQSRPETFYGGYRTVAELYADLTAANAANPTLTELVDYGDSYCKQIGGCTTPGGQSLAGHDLWAIRVTNEAVAGSSTISGTTIISGTKPVFVLVSDIHAREITTPELAMRMLDWLLDGYGLNADATWMVDWHEIWIVPTVNPDGHWLVELGTLPPYNSDPFYQRKNGHQLNCNQWPPNSFSQYGTDLNRNHSFQWGGGGSSTDPCSQTYRGPGAASEPEVWALQDLVTALIPDQRGPNLTDPAPEDTKGLLITNHSYSELVLWPWGFTTTQAPNRVGLEAIGDKFATYNGYTSCQPSLCLYNVNGSTDDWSYGELGIPSYTFEVGTQFMPPYSEVDQVQWPGNGPAYIYAARIARTPYITVKGPDALNVLVSAPAGTNVTLTANINDTSNGNNPIAAAAYYLDSPPWVNGAVANPMQASDGNFNSTNEGVTATIDTSSLASGVHLLYVRGQDNQGNWGPVSAAFLEVNVVGPNAAFLSSSPDALGQTTVFTNTSTFGNNPTYQWDFGDGNNSTAAKPTHIYTNIGTYNVILTVTDEQGSDSTLGSVTIIHGPEANFVSSSPDPLGYFTTFINYSAGTDISYLWDFGDGVTTNEQTPVHRYGAAGNYLVTLTVTNLVGSDSYQAMVEIYDPFAEKIFVPLIMK